MVQQMSRHCVIFVIALAALSIVGQERRSCSEPVLRRPSSYTRESELFYLAWIEHGRAGQKALASQVLLDLDQKTEYDTTQKLWQCEKDGLLKNASLFSLFDQKPADHAPQLQKLAKPHDFVETYTKQLENLDGFVPTKYVSFMQTGNAQLKFDRRDNAAARLIKGGYLSEQAFEVIILLARTKVDYPHRVAAKGIFDLFVGIPPLELGEPYDFNRADLYSAKYTEADNRRQGQIDKILQWFRQNRKKLTWDANQKKYRLP